MSGGDCLGSLTTFRSPQSDYEIRSTSAIQVFYVYLLYQISAVRRLYYIGLLIEKIVPFSLKNRFAQST